MKTIISTSLIVITTFFAHASIVITNGLTHRHSVSHSTTEEGLVVIKNVSKKPERVVIYLMDLPVGCESEDFSVTKPGTHERSCANWISLESEERTLGPGEEYPLKYEMNIPKGEFTGSYWTVLMVEVKGPIDTTRNQYTIQINSNVRYAIQLIADFPELDEKVNVTFSDIKLIKDEDQTAVIVQLKNESSKLLMPDIKLEVYDAEGELLLEGRAEKKKLYPLQCKSYVVPIDKLKKGLYEAVLVADCGEADLFGMTLNLNVSD